MQLPGERRAYREFRTAALPRPSPPARPPASGRLNPSATLLLLPLPSNPPTLQDNWQDPCVPASATEQRWNTGAGALEAFDAVYLFDDAAGLCVTCEQWTTTQNVSTGEPYQVGDFACVAGSSVQLEDGTAGVSPIHFDCADGDVGTRSGLACPAGAVEDAAPEALVFAEEAGLDCALALLPPHCLPTYHDECIA